VVAEAISGYGGCGGGCIADESVVGEFSWIALQYGRRNLVQQVISSEYHEHVPWP